MGSLADEVTFLEGISNLGDAQMLASPNKR
jgi:hypothetical protein